MSQDPPTGDEASPQEAQVDRQDDTGVPEPAEASRTPEEPPHELEGGHLRCPFCYKRLPEEWIPQEERHVTLDLAFWGVSEYIFRGVPLFDEGALQGSANVDVPLPAGNSLGLGLWGSLDLSHESDGGLFVEGNGSKPTEYIIEAEYRAPLGALQGVAGARSYSFPNVFNRTSTTEVYLGVDAGDLSLRAFRDVEEIDGTYVNLAYQTSVPLTERLSLEVGASAAWVDENMGHATYGLPESGFADLMGNLGLRYSPKRGPTWNFGLHASTLIDDDLETRLENADFDTDNFWASIGISWQF